MFRLIKLAIYGLLGYAIYEFIRGLTSAEGGAQAAGAGQGQQPQRQGGGGGSRELNRALDENAGRTNMTGPGIGEAVTTAEPSGESVTHRVGRGVVRK